MAREYSPYIIIETTFILSDPRYKKLPATAKVLFIALWARAFQDRRGTLPDWYDTAAMQEDSNLDARTTRKCVAILEQKRLIDILDDGRIRVIGVKNKGNIKWKEEGKSLPEDLNTNVTTPLSKKRKEEKRREEVVMDIARDALAHLNKAAGTDFKATTKATQKHIRARIKEGATLENFKRVIDTKVPQWLNNEKMCQYIRPSTLFNGEKFEGYLNEIPHKNKKRQLWETE